MQDAIDQFMVGKQYSEKNVPLWINDICEDVIKKLVGLQKPYKYMTNCTIMQKNGAGCVMSHNSFWDSGADLSASMIWPNKQTKAEQMKSTIQCVIAVYAISLVPS